MVYTYSTTSKFATHTFTQAGNIWIAKLGIHCIQQQNLAAFTTPHITDTLLMPFLLFQHWPCLPLPFQQAITSGHLLFAISDFLWQFYKVWVNMPFLSQPLQWQAKQLGPIHLSPTFLPSQTLTVFHHKLQQLTHPVSPLIALQRVSLKDFLWTLCVSETNKRPLNYISTMDSSQDLCLCLNSVTAGLVAANSGLIPTLLWATIFKVRFGQTLTMLFIYLSIHIWSSLVRANISCLLYTISGALMNTLYTL